ncbi:MAG: hypothetical protein M3Q97_06200, partial [Bacteroidota bacterium]|nr:hypothetical protein [Bacteroidota bacterium]
MEQEIIKRPVKFATVHRKDLIGFGNNETEGKEYAFRKEAYNKEGKLIQQITFNSQGYPVEEINYLYDDKGKVILHEMKNYIEDSVERTTFKYDSNGQVTEEALHFGDELYETLHSAYDADGFETERRRRGEEGNILERETYVKGPNGKRIQQRHYNEEGEADWQLDVEFNKAGLAVKETTTYFEDQNKEIARFTYDDRGNRTSAELKNEAGELVSLTTYDYNGMNKPRKIVRVTKGYYPSEMAHQMVYDDT